MRKRMIVVKKNDDYGRRAAIARRFSALLRDVHQLGRLPAVSLADRPTGGLCCSGPLTRPRAEAFQPGPTPRAQRLARGADGQLEPKLDRGALLGRDDGEAFVKSRASTPRLVHPQGWACRPGLSERKKVSGHEQGRCFLFPGRTSLISASCHISYWVAWVLKAQINLPPVSDQDPKSCDGDVQAIGDKEVTSVSGTSGGGSGGSFSDGVVPLGKFVESERQEKSKNPTCPPGPTIIPESNSEADCGLSSLISSWASLPAHIKQAILLLVHAEGGEKA